MKNRNSYDSWKKLLRKYDEETTNTAIPPIGSIPHPNESVTQSVLFPEEDERSYEKRMRLEDADN